MLWTTKKDDIPRTKQAARRDKKRTNSVHKEDRNLTNTVLAGEIYNTSADEDVRKRSEDHLLDVMTSRQRTRAASQTLRHG